jgi:hypothetical protein
MRERGDGERSTRDGLQTVDGEGLDKFWVLPGPNPNGAQDRNIRERGKLFLDLITLNFGF